MPDTSLGFRVHKRSALERLTKPHTCPAGYNHVHFGNANCRFRPETDLRWPSGFGQEETTAAVRPFCEEPMLSKHTLQFLDSLCATSHSSFPEGGVLWTYVEGANQGHMRFADPRRKPPAAAMDLKQLGSWLQAALGDRSDVTEQSVGIAKQLVGLLQVDLNVDSFLWVFQDDGYDMTANIHMMRASDNRYFALELWWSVD